MNSRKLLFLDNSYIVATGFKQIIYEHFNAGLSVKPITGNFTNNAWISEIKFDLVIIGNISGDVVAMLHAIKQSSNSTRVMIFTDTYRYSDAMCLLLAGANGYLRQDASSEEIARATRTILNDQRYLCRELLEAMAQEDLESKIQQKILFRTQCPDLSVNLIDSLPNRQKQIILGLMRGESVSFMASQLGISTSTVGTHKAIAFKKLGVKSVIQLINTYYTNLNVY